MKKVDRNLLNRIDKLIALRRREILTNVFNKYIFSYYTIPHWQFSGDIAQDKVINALYRKQDEIVGKYVDKTKCYNK